MKWRYFTWTMNGNVHDFARVLREKRPHWDVLSVDSREGITVALCRVPFDAPLDDWEGK